MLGLKLNHICKRDPRAENNWYLGEYETKYENNRLVFRTQPPQPKKTTKWYTHSMDKLCGNAPIVSPFIIIVSITVTSHEWALRHLKSPGNWLFVQQFIQVVNNKLIKTLHYCPFLRESTDGFPSERFHNFGNVSMSWCHHTCSWT